MSHKPVIEMSVAELINRFERNVLFDAHGTRTKVRRSDARKELTRRGVDVLTEIVEHLRTSPPDDRRFLRTAWGMFFVWVQTENNLEGGPVRVADLDGWIAWAEANAAA